MPNQEPKGSRILIVDDETPNIELLESLLRRRGFTNLWTTTDSRDVVGLFREIHPDLVLLDLRMPHMDGFEVMEALRSEIPADTYLPILVLTGSLGPDVQLRCLAAGAKDFVNKPFRVEEVMIRIRNLLETRHLHLRLQCHNERLERHVAERTADLGRAKDEILHRLARAAEYRDDITGQHAERVGIVSALIARGLGLSKTEVALIRRAAPLHDVGKIGIPDHILLKRGDLTPEEFEVMKSHTDIGASILANSSFPILDMAREIASSHHERWDGSGYTRGLAGEQIPLVGRIVAIADAFDCMTHQRQYKLAHSVDDALARMREDRGTHFDPSILDLFEGLVLDGRVAEAVSGHMGHATV